MGVSLIKIRGSELGSSLLEVLFTTILSATLFLGIIQQYSGVVKSSYDEKVRIATNLQAQAILQTMGLELRILGNGVPFDQPNFGIGNPSLTAPAVTEPILVNEAARNHVAFRLNEAGNVSILTQKLDTTANETIVQLTDTSAVHPNDQIYISNSVVAGHDGLYGIVNAVNNETHTVTLAFGYVASNAAVFNIGSTFEVVPVVTYDSPADGSGITRDSGYGPVLLGKKSSMSIAYLDADGQELPLPLNNDVVISSLRAVRITVSHTSPDRLVNGQYYTATMQQTFAIRNLALVF